MKELLRSIYLWMVCLLAFTATACQADDGDVTNAALSPPIYVDIEPHEQVPVIAHRGYWQGDTRPQNSLAAFRAALALNIYGTECDVRQTKDGVLVICHDAQYDGLTISKSTYAELCTHPLANGEPLPRLEELIQEFKLTDTAVKLVIEIKECNVETLLTMVEGYHIADRVIFISFGNNYCNQLVKRGRGPQTFYLSGNMTPQQIKDAGYAGFDYKTSVLNQYPFWIDAAHQLGLKTIVWTVNDKEEIAKYRNQGVIVTTDRPMYAEGAVNIEH